MDEWQEVPSVWDATRRAVDETGVCDMYLLTGSLAPAMNIEALCESVAQKTTLDPVLMRRVLFALARTDGGSTSVETIARDSTAGENPTSSDRATVAHYLNYLEQNYLLRNLGGWDAPVKARARTRTRPKRYLVDPSLTASVLGYDPTRLLLDHQLLGVLFESLCIHDPTAYLASSTRLRNLACFAIGTHTGSRLMSS